MAKFFEGQNEGTGVEPVCEQQARLGLSAFTSKRIPVWARGARVFHVMVYGRRDSDLIFSKGEAERFMFSLAEKAGTRGVSILHYAVMNNHIHLVLFAPEWKVISATVRSASMALAKYVRLRDRSDGSVYSKRILYSVCPTSGALLRVMRYVSANAKEAVHACYLSALKEFMYGNFLFVDQAAVCKLIGRDISTVSNLLVVGSEDFSFFMKDFFRESEKSRAFFLPDGVYGERTGGREFRDCATEVAETVSRSVSDERCVGRAVDGSGRAAGGSGQAADWRRTGVGRAKVGQR